MADSRTASAFYMRKVQKIVDVQQKIIYLLLSIIVAFGLTYGIANSEMSNDQIYVMFLLFLSIGLWLTEAVPPFTVGLLIIGFLIFALGGYYNITEGEGEQYTQKYIQTWSNSVIWLMLGGFFIAEAMQKVGLDKYVFKQAISKFGTQSRYVLLGVMLVTAVFSMIMSNTATTAMMIAAIMPFINTLQADKSFGKALLMGVPISASIGGMGTIIGSPPNAVAVEALNQSGLQFGFLEWMIFGFPTAIILVIIMWWALMKKYKLKVATVNITFLNSLDTSNESKLFLMKKKVVSVVLIVTLLLWLTGNIHHIPASAVSFLPIVLLTMLGVISGEDVRKIPWDTLMLVAGGLSLGLAITETGLAAYFVGMVKNYELNIYALMVVFSLLTIIFSNFMSNTATATILIPIAIILIPENILPIALTIGLSASSALFLPISTPPNAIAFSTGKVSQKDFHYGGIIAGLVGPTIIITIILLLQLLLY